MPSEENHRRRQKRMAEQERAAAAAAEVVFHCYHGNHKAAISRAVKWRNRKVCVSCYNSIQEGNRHVKERLASESVSRRT